MYFRSKNTSHSEQYTISWDMQIQLQSSWPTTFHQRNKYAKWNNYLTSFKHMLSRVAAITAARNRRIDHPFAISIWQLRYGGVKHAKIDRMAEDTGDRCGRHEHYKSRVEKREWCGKLLLICNELRVPPGPLDVSFFASTPLVEYRCWICMHHILAALLADTIACYLYLVL